MDQRFSDYIHDLEFDDNHVLPYSNQYKKFENPNLDPISIEPPLDFDDSLISSINWSPEPESYESPSLNLSSEPDLSPNTFISSISWSPETDPLPSSSLSLEGGSVHSPPLSNDSDSEDPILKYLKEMLMEEENVDETAFVVHDSSALRATEESLNEILAGNHPPSSEKPSVNVSFNTPKLDDTFGGSSSAGYGGTGNSIDHQLEEYHSSPLQNSSPPTDNVFNSGTELSINEFLVQNMFSDKESVLQFQRGLEEARKFLPTGNQLNIDNDIFSSESNREVKNDRESSTIESWSKKNHEREDVDLVEGRTNKQPAVYFDESELSEMFDKVLLFGQNPDQSSCRECDEVVVSQNEANNSLQPDGSNSKGRRSRGKRQNKMADESVDLRTLLILNAQAISSNDRRTATELLKQIRQHSSPLGDGSQRLAHYFANGLEARLAGTGTQKYPINLPLERISVADILKAFHLYLSCSPFKKLAIAYTIKTILRLSEKATSIHIVDFGIGYGFQWPTLIWNLAYRAGGPPKLRITGIDIPQPGFRPAEGIEQAGRRLANYCERFKVPFEYNAIASQNWETIQLEDLKIDESETLFVSCLFKFHNLFDETVEKSSPRDVVLNLIKEMKPVAFIHSIVSGSYNSPFFVTRFREALFHYSALFDMFDTTVSREDQDRLMCERELCGREAMNVISCEGLERIQRPETYKQWHVRSLSAGLRPLPMDQELMSKVRGKLTFHGYHKDFNVDEASNWLLQGWKGRILFASSSWASK